MREKETIILVSIIILIVSHWICIIFLYLQKNILLEKINNKDKQINILLQENYLLKVERKIIENKIKDAILQEEIRKDLDSVNRAIDFFNGREKSDTLSR